MGGESQQAGQPRPDDRSHPDADDSAPRNAPPASPSHAQAPQAALRPIPHTRVIFIEIRLESEPSSRDARPRLPAARLVTEIKRGYQA